MSAIGLLALDDRPCNTLGPYLLARDFDKEITFLAPKDLESSQCDLIIISLDRYIFGGLVESRTMDVTDTQARLRFSQLESLIANGPSNRKYYLSSVILRLSVTLKGVNGLDNWKNLFRRNVLADPDFPRTPEENRELLEIERKLPGDLVDHFLGARARNHWINAQAIELVKKYPDKIRHLFLGQEDCAPRGIHRREKESLEALVQKHALQSKVHIVTGADELGEMLLSQALSKDSRHCLRFFTQNRRSLEMISLYEDVSVLRNLELHANAVGFESLESLNFSSDDGPYVHILGSPPQRDLSLEDVSYEPILHAGDFKNAFVLDLNFANGASPDLGICLAKNLPLGLSAWNTTGNRLGSLLARAKLQLSLPKSGTDGVWWHILDDCFYQGAIRSKLNNICKQRQWNPWDLEVTQARELETFAQNEMTKWTTRVGFASPVQVTLPWNRTFEAQIKWW